MGASMKILVAVTGLAGFCKEIENQTGFSEYGALKRLFYKIHELNAIIQGEYKEAHFAEIAESERRRIARRYAAEASEEE